MDSGETPPSTYSPIEDKDLPVKLRRLLNPDLQRYIFEAPPLGFGILYATVSPFGKMYVGQHCCYGEGRSFASARMDKIKNPGCEAIRGAYLKYGIENMRHFVIGLAPAGILESEYADDTNALEKYYIGPDGLDSMTPKGYNLSSGGKNGQPSQESKDRMSASQKNRWELLRANPAAMAKVSVSIKKAKDQSYGNHREGELYRQRLSKATTKVNAEIRMDEERYTKRREKRLATRKKNQLVKDAKTWIAKFAACNDDDEVRCKIREYEKILANRERNRRSETRKARSQSLPFPPSLEPHVPKSKHGQSVSEGKKRAFADPVEGPKKRQRISDGRKKKTLVKDALKWIPMFAACDDDDQVRVLLRKYESIAKKREAQIEYSKQKKNCV